MCVAITLAPGTDLSQQEVERMNRSNADGVGVAWARRGVVQWFKTTKVDPEYVTQMIRAWKDFPRLVHFRYATAGGTRPDLCHPFEIGPQAACKPVGFAQKVMIHNGHWNRWTEVRDLLHKEDILPDNGPWSDTRLAAFLAHMDPDWLTALGGRVAIMTGDGETHRIGDWQELRQGIHVSNKSWDTDSKYTRGGYSGFRAWKGWGWDEAEHEAFWAEQEARDKEAFETALKEADDRKKEEKESRGKERQSKREEKRAGSQAVDGTGRAANGGSHLKVADPSCGPCATDDRNSYDCSGKPGDACEGCDAGKCSNQDKLGSYQIIDGVKCSLKPWFNIRDGKWYKTMARGGRATVVEVAPPGSPAPIAT